MSDKTKAWVNRVGIIATAIGLVMVKVSGGDPEAVAGDIGGWIAIGGAAFLGLWELGRTIIERIKG
jgi:hypothetical protein